VGHFVLLALGHRSSCGPAGLPRAVEPLKSAPENRDNRSRFTGLSDKRARRGCRGRNWRCEPRAAVIIVNRMAGPNEQSVRRPAVAGTFYPDHPDECRALASQYLRAAAPVEAPAGSRPWLGGIVP